MSKYSLPQDQFDKLMSDKAWQVNQLSIEDGPEQKIKTKSGTRKVVTYEDREIAGRMVKAAVANISNEEVYRERVIKTKIVNFEFCSEDDEKSYLESIKQ